MRMTGILYILTGLELEKFTLSKWSMNYHEYHGEEVDWSNSKSNLELDVFDCKVGLEKLLFVMTVPSQREWLFSWLYHCLVLAGKISPKLGGFCDQDLCG